MKNLLMAVAILSMACTEVTVLTEPGDVSVSTGGVEAEVTDDPSTNAISLKPPSITMGVGATVSTQVIVVNSRGVEIPSAGIAVAIGDTAIVLLAGVEGRFVVFQGKAVGTTTAIITASGVQASIDIVVE